MIVAASREKALSTQARARRRRRASTSPGICCTANEILMRQGMPVAGNYLHQELALLTGAVDLMVVDVQCVMPSLPQVAACHHTKVVTTSAKAAHPRAPSASSSSRPHARETARDDRARARSRSSRRRDPARVKVPQHRTDLVAGFTNENLPRYLGGRFRAGLPAADRRRRRRPRARRRRRRRLQHGALRAGPAPPGARARACSRATCSCVQTGCSAIASAKAGLLRPEAALEHAGPGLREVCETVGIPPVLHLGSCVDNSRILSVCAAICAEGGIGADFSELPVAAAAPEAMSEKAIAIGLYAVASGIFTVFMPPPHLAGSSVVRQYLEHDVERDTGGRFLFTNDVEEAAQGDRRAPRPASARRSSSRRCSTATASGPGAVARRARSRPTSSRGAS